MATPISHAVYQGLLDKGVVSDPPDSVRRCIIDIRAGEPVRVLIERVGGEELLSLGDLLDDVTTNEGGQ